MARTRHNYRREEVEDFGGKLRHFNESLAQRERRLLRSMIIAALEDENDTGGYQSFTDEQLFAALEQMLTAEGEA